MRSRARPASIAEDLVTGRGAAWNARARFPAASTLKVAIAVEALRTHTGKPEPGSYLDSLLRAMLSSPTTTPPTRSRATFGGGGAVDELLRGLGIGDTWMGGGYLHGTPVLPPIPRPGREPAIVPLLQVHDRLGPRAPAHRRAPRRRREGRARGALRRGLHAVRCALPALPARPRAATGASSGASSAAARTRSCTRRAGSRTARHDAGLVYWPGGVFVAVVMTYGSGVGVGSDVLAGHVRPRRLWPGSSTWGSYRGGVVAVRSSRSRSSPRRSRRSSGSRSPTARSARRRWPPTPSGTTGSDTWRLTARR